MNKAESVMIDVIKGKCEHVQNFMDDFDTDAAEQTLEEIQELCNYLQSGKLSTVKVETPQEQSDLFDAITTRKLF